MPTLLRNWKAVERDYSSKTFSHEDFCCTKCTHMKPGLLLIKMLIKLDIYFELKLDFQKVLGLRGSTATQFPPDNVLLLWADTQAAAWLRKKKKTRHAGEHVQQTLGMFRYLFRYSKKEEEGRKKQKRKKEGGILDWNRHTNRGTAWCMRNFLFGISCATLTNDRPQGAVSSYSYLCLDWLLMTSWQRARATERLIEGLQQHLDIKALPVPAKKLRHISGIFQVMMCGCGSTGEREADCTLFVCSERAPYSIPVSSAYFGSSWGRFCFKLYIVLHACFAHLWLHICFCRLEQTWQTCHYCKWDFKRLEKKYWMTLGLDNNYIYSLFVQEVRNEASQHKTWQEWIWKSLHPHVCLIYLHCACIEINCANLMNDTMQILTMKWLL